MDDLKLDNVCLRLVHLCSAQVCAVAGMTCTQPNSEQVTEG